MDGRSNARLHDLVKFYIRNKSDNFIWSLVAVYNAAKKIIRLLRDMVNILIGGDFNMFRFQHEKSSGCFDNNLSFLFNVVIDSLDLKEVHMTGSSPVRTTFQSTCARNWIAC